RFSRDWSSDVCSSDLELLKVDPTRVCGIKVFQGSSTGDMLVDNPQTLENIFSKCKILIATHSENDVMIKRNLERFQEKYGEDIRSEERRVGKEGRSY